MREVEWRMFAKAEPEAEICGDGLAKPKTSGSHREDEEDALFQIKWKSLENEEEDYNSAKMKGSLKLRYSNEDVTDMKLTIRARETIPGQQVCGDRMEVPLPPGVDWKIATERHASHGMKSHIVKMSFACPKTNRKIRVTIGLAYEDQASRNKAKEFINALEVANDRTMASLEGTTSVPLGRVKRPTTQLRRRAMMARLGSSAPNLHLGEIGNPMNDASTAEMMSSFGNSSPDLMYHGDHDSELSSIESMTLFGSSAPNLMYDEDIQVGERPGVKPDRQSSSTLSGRNPPAFSIMKAKESSKGMQKTRRSSGNARPSYSRGKSDSALHGRRLNEGINSIAKGNIVTTPPVVVRKGPASRSSSRSSAA